MVDKAKKRPGKRIKPGEGMEQYRAQTQALVRPSNIIANFSFNVPKEKLTEVYMALSDFILDSVIHCSPIKITFKQGDNCQRCHGISGGVPGNENIIDGEVLCDYCHAKIMTENGK